MLKGSKSILIVERELKVDVEQEFVQNIKDSWLEQLRGLARWHFCLTNKEMDHEGYSSKGR